MASSQFGFNDPRSVSPVARRGPGGSVSDRVSSLPARSVSVPRSEHPRLEALVTNSLSTRSLELAGRAGRLATAPDGTRERRPFHRGRDASPQSQAPGPEHYGNIVGETPVGQRGRYRGGTGLSAAARTALDAWPATPRMTSSETRVARSKMAAYRSVGTALAAAESVRERGPADRTACPGSPSAGCRGDRTAVANGASTPTSCQARRRLDYTHII